MSDDSPCKNPGADHQALSDSANSAGAKEDPESKQKKLQVLLAGLWEKSRQTIADRIEILQQARSLAAAGKLDEPARLRAADSAHKLAGVLGTFGLPRGTELAREAEELFERHATAGAAGSPAIEGPELERLSSLLDDLAGLIQKPGSTLEQ